MKKRLLALLLAVVMLLGIAPVAMAEEGPALVYRCASYNLETNEWYEDDSEPMTGDTLNVPYKDGMYISFYFAGGGKPVKVTKDELTASGSVQLADEEYNGFVLVQGSECGDGTISYDNNGTTYSINVKVADNNGNQGPTVPAGLNYFGVGNDDGGNYVEWYQENVQSDYPISLTPGILTWARFYYYSVENDANRIRESNVTVSSGSNVTVEKVTENKGTENEESYWRISAESCGTSTLTVTVGGTEYDVTVNVELPYYGYYSERTRSESTFSTDFTYSENCTIWMMTPNGLTETETEGMSLDIGGVGAVPIPDIGEQTESSIAYWVERGENTKLYDLCIKPTDPNGGGYSINLVDNADGWENWVAYCMVSGGNSGSGGEDSGNGGNTPSVVPAGFNYFEVGNDNGGNYVEWYQGNVQSDYTIYLNPGISTWARFYYYSVENDANRIRESNVTVSSGSNVTVEKVTENKGTENEESYWRISAESCGTSTLTVTVNGTAYEVTVSVALPQYGFYTEQNRNESTFSTSFDYSTNETIWIMTPNGLSKTEAEKISLAFGETTITIPSVGEHMESSTAYWVERGEGTALYDLCINLTDPGTGGYNVFIKSSEGRNLGNCWVYTSSGGSGGDSGNDGGHTPSVIPAGLNYCNMSGTGGADVQEGNIVAGNTIAQTPGTTMWYRFYYYNVENDTDPTIATNVQVKTGNSVSVSKNTVGNYWVVRAHGLGTTILAVTAGNETYEAIINVALPEYSFHSKQERNRNTFLSPVNYAGLDAGKVIWMMTENGITAEETRNITMTMAGENVTIPAIGQQDDSHVAYWVERNNADVYDLYIKLSDPGTDSYSVNLYSQQGTSLGYVGVLNINTQGIGGLGQGNAAYIGDYAVGFGFEAGEGVTIINRGEWVYGGSTTLEENPDNDREFYREFAVYAGIPKYDAQGNVYYEIDNSGAVGITINELWIDTIAGNTETFSWSSDKNSTVTKITNLDGATSAGMYIKKGYVGEAIVRAKVTMTLGNETKVETIAVPIFYNRTIVGINETRPDNDTVRDLNEWLEKKAKTLNLGATNVEHNLTLGNTTYKGTIIIPEEFQHGNNTLNILGQRDPNGQKKTVVEGGIDLNGSYIMMLMDVHFKAPESDEATYGVYNGGCGQLDTCTFQGYDIAVDSSSAGNINVRYSVFADNDIAVRVDIEETERTRVTNEWTGNSFIGNGTAIKLLSLNSAQSAYYFRIKESNFIGNTTDFYTEEEGTIYLQKNYFGQFKKNQHPESNSDRISWLYGAKTESAVNSLRSSPNIEIAKSVKNKSKVITNPRYKFPVQYWWNFNISVESIFGGTSPVLYSEEKEYENYLTADWETATQIVAEEANSLILDEKAFDTATEGEGEKKIDVVDKNENPVGTWNFDTEEE